MEEILKQAPNYGIAIFIVMYIVKETVKIVNNIKSGNGKTTKDTCDDKLVLLGFDHQQTEKTLDTIKELLDSIKDYSEKTFDMHNVRDQDGNFIWYSNKVSKELQDISTALKEVAKHTEKQTIIFKMALSKQLNKDN